MSWSRSDKTANDGHTDWTSKRTSFKEGELIFEALIVPEDESYILKIELVIVYRQISIDSIMDTTEQEGVGHSYAWSIRHIFYLNAPSI